MTWDAILEKLRRHEQWLREARFHQRASYFGSVISELEREHWRLEQEESSQLGDGGAGSAEADRASEAGEGPAT